MAENFAQYLILHRYIRLAPYMIPKLRLDHAEGALDVGALVIMLQEFLPVEREVVKHLLPQPTGCPAMNALEGNIRRAP